MRLVKPAGSLDWLRFFDYCLTMYSQKTAAIKGVSRMESQEQFSSPLDTGIKDAVLALRRAGVETFESCEGGAGHAFPEPTVRFHGDRSEGFRALAAAMQAGLNVADLRRVWPVNDGEPTGPWWELTFVPHQSRMAG
jgi:hypothetical protein